MEVNILACIAIALFILVPTIIFTYHLYKNSSSK